MAVGADRTTIEKLLKEWYIPGVVRQVNDEVLMLNRLESQSDNITEGLRAVVAVDLGRTAGIGPARERGALPEAGSQRPNRATYNLKYLYGRGQVTGQAQRGSATNQAAFLRALKFEADGLKRDLKKDLARQIYGGYDIAGAAAAGGVDASAAIAKILTDNGAGSYELTSDAPIRQGHIYVGMVLDTTDNFVSIENAAPMVVASVDLANKDVVMEADEVGADAGDFFVRRGTVDASGNVGVTGLSAVISAAELGGLDPTDPGLDEWQSEVDSSGGVFDIDKLHQVFNKVRIRSGDEPKSVITTFGIQREYYKDLQGQVQFVEPMKLESGFRTLEFMDRPFIADVDCPLGSIYLVDEAAIKVFAQSDFAPLDQDGSLLHWVTGYDMWEWALQRDMELGANQRNSSGKLTGITDVGY